MPDDRAHEPFIILRCVVGSRAYGLGGEGPTPTASRRKRPAAPEACPSLARPEAHSLGGTSIVVVGRGNSP